MVTAEQRQHLGKRDLSVIICAHNPRADYLRLVLNALRCQTLPVEQWELILVDNASSAPLSSWFDLSWHPHGRHVREPQLGIAKARRRGMLEAAADVIVFVDDDNILDNDYLSVANAIKDQWPTLGTWGSGIIALEFERPPSKSLTRYFPYLAFRDSKSPRWSNIAPSIDATPVGAGLCVRRNVAAAYCEMFDNSEIKITSREGKSLLGHEDFEISYVACHMGLGMGVFPELKITHLIPSLRITEDYLVKLYEGGRVSSMILAYKWQGLRPESPLTPRGILSILASTLARRGIDRRMYFANLCATLTARRMIDKSRAGRGL